MRSAGDIDSPEEGAVLDRRTLNRSLLARQLLLERANLPALEAVDRLVGMQAQVPLDPYVGLWSRVADFDPDACGQSLLERRLVRMTLMRTTLHLVGAGDSASLRAHLQGTIERAFASSPFARQLAELELAPVLARGVELLEQEPLTTAQLAAALAAHWPGRDPSSLAYAVRYLVPLVQVTPRGVWGKRLQPKLTTLESWLGQPPPATLTLEELVRRYLRAFGPASPADIRAWSGLPDLRSVLDRLRPQLSVYRDQAGRELYDVRDGLFVDRFAHAPVRFLPQFDNLFLAHADRSRIIDQVGWGSSFTGRGAVFIDGFLSGAWRLKLVRREAILSVELRNRVGAADRKEVRSEAEALLAFMAPGAQARRLSVDSA